MVRSALAAAEAAGTLDATDGAAISLVVANAWALDQAEADSQPFAVAQLTAPFVELMEKTGLLAPKEVEDDTLRAFITDLARAD